MKTEGLAESKIEQRARHAVPLRSAVSIAVVTRDSTAMVACYGRNVAKRRVAPLNGRILGTERLRLKLVTEGRAKNALVTRARHVTTEFED